MQFAVFNVDCSRVLFNMKKLGHFRTSKNSPNKTTQSITFKFCKGCLNTFKNKRLVFGFRENECLIFKVSFSSLFLNLHFVSFLSSFYFISVRVDVPVSLTGCRQCLSKHLFLIVGCIVPDSLFPERDHTL